MVNEKKADEGASDQARVLEAVIRTWQLAGRPTEIAGRDILAQYNAELEEPEKLKSKALGWRLRKLQLPKRHGDKGSLYKTERRKLYRLARRYIPSLAMEMSETSETLVSLSNPLTILSDNSPSGPQTKRQPGPSQADNSDISDVSDVSLEQR